jgi:hypothetical protein
MPQDQQLSEDAQITVGLYYWPTGERLSVFNNCGELQPNNSFTLTPTEESCD